MKFRPMGSKRTLPPFSIRWRATEHGNILVYIVMTMVIFGLLGALMVSLFSTSVSSSATSNDSRRAFYLSESGLRYGMSELRSNDFSKTVVADLNDLTYSVSPSGSFDIFAFGHYFESPTEQTDKSKDDFISLKVKKGEIPQAFLAQIPTSSPFISIFNIDRAPALGTKSAAAISGYTYADAKSFGLKLEDDFSISDGNSVCFAVQPNGAQNFVPTGGAYASLDLKPEARYIFPKTDGSFKINDNRATYFYKRSEDKTDYIRLHNITVTGGVMTSTPVAAEDYITIDRNNFIVTSVGQSGAVKFGGDMDHSVSLSDHSLGPETRKEDIGDDNLNYSETPFTSSWQRTQTNTNLIRLNETDKTIVFGAGPGPSLGSTWFKDTRSIGGQTDFCSAGKCLFGAGIRVFFTFKSINDSGEGVIFAITNGDENSISSAGGDIQRSELLGYAGDSRLTNPSLPDTPDFLDGVGRGLLPPKIGLELDTRVNYSAAFEKDQRFCSGNDLVENTRNDPLSSDKHAAQYVFWAKDFLNLSCRNTPGRGTYDDNRHDAVGYVSGNWAKALFGDTRSSPVIGSDGTIYIGSADNRLFAIRPDGVTEKWSAFSEPTGEVFSPVIRGNIFFNAADNKVYAVNPSNGNRVWLKTLPGLITERPAVDAGFVYVSSSNSLFKLVDSNGNTAVSKFPPETLTSPPALSPSGQVIYIGFDDGKLHARKTLDLEEAAGWPSAAVGLITKPPTVDKITGLIYVSAGNKVCKINPAAPASPQQFSVSGASPTSAPTLSKDGATVYVGFSNGRLYALNTSDMSPKWPYYPPSGSIGSSIATPEVDDNENIYFGSDNNSIYALFADGSLKWEFNTGGVVAAKPAINENGVIYVGSNYSGGQLWAINQFSEPRNYRQNFQNPPNPELAKNLIAVSASEAVNPYFTSVTNTNKWFKDGPWAVRLEIDRTALSGERARYTLRTWAQQCSDENCTNLQDKFYKDTRVKYAFMGKEPNLVQSFELDSTLNTKFRTFLFGFTSAKRDNSDDQLITIDSFKLSFIRPGDPEVNAE